MTFVTGRKRRVRLLPDITENGQSAVSLHTSRLRKKSKTAKNMFCVSVPTGMKTDGFTLTILSEEKSRCPKTLSTRCS